MADSILTSARLRELVSYDRETGVFTRLIDSYRKTALAGSRPGSVFRNGYVYFSVSGNLYLAHRLAWLYVHGHWPINDIDHINGDRLDNRISNLRDVERRVNNENRHNVRSDNKSSGMTGVSWHIHSKKWRARIWHKGTEYRIGLFDTPEEASLAYLKAKRILHEGCTI